jgi:hypothetical protein
MFIHSVYFWLRDDLTAEERTDFRRGVETLKTVPSVKFMDIGTPANTDRPVIDNTYSVAEIAVFDDKAAQDIYQNHPIHLQFVEDCARYWTRVLVYDVEA